jgi:hypothetical protein
MKVYTVLFKHQCDEHFSAPNRKMFIKVEDAIEYKHELLLEKESIDVDHPDFPYTIERAVLIEEEVY